MGSEVCWPHGHAPWTVEIARGSLSFSFSSSYSVNARCRATAIHGAQGTRSLVNEAPYEESHMRARMETQAANHAMSYLLNSTSKYLDLNFYGNDLLFQCTSCDCFRGARGRWVQRRCGRLCRVGIMVPHVLVVGGRCMTSKMLFLATAHLYQVWWAPCGAHRAPQGVWWAPCGAHRAPQAGVAGAVRRPPRTSSDSSGVAGAVRRPPCRADVRALLLHWWTRATTRLQPPVRLPFHGGLSTPSSIPYLPLNTTRGATPNRQQP